MNQIFILSVTEDDFALSPLLTSLQLQKVYFLFSITSKKPTQIPSLFNHFIVHPNRTDLIPTQNLFVKKLTFFISPHLRNRILHIPIKIMYSGASTCLPQL